MTQRSPVMYTTTSHGPLISSLAQNVGGFSWRAEPCAAQKCRARVTEAQQVGVRAPLWSTESFVRTITITSVKQSVNHDLAVRPSTEFVTVGKQEHHYIFQQGLQPNHHHPLLQVMG